ncbi:vWFA-like protein with metal ion dependent adhesion motif (MIDAS) [Candidatus Rhodobacter oscarellae]|uniref:VWFA-like protein with metal ion dependent adhesion motif (MIDAS) n=1 Tax=Candidatus Rhodobacter oscarellae TaxID=1675527 RepID=A0A0J9GVF3_9RHOB|nr:DUF1194 domain-containing protein [Candidatus Rhodobacter lobularis]KMW57553.1 vWFA-like protein with metal ion dependent adhesion motif (MIDAS) [Candidatus Rhodobacter lobularis]
MAAALLRVVALIFLALPAQADGIEVDLELVLMVDVSRSMTERELEIQRRGYAEALQSDAVYAAVKSGLLQRVAMTYVEWAGTQRVVVDWRVLETRDDLAAFANTLTAEFNPALRRTSISGALLYGAETIRTNPYEGLRRVIDVSGDGPNNQGRPVRRARDTVLAQGIVINGLPLMTREGMGAQWHLDDLDRYYEACVIGGPGSFVIPVLDWDDFAEAVRRKLVLEMVSRPATAQIIPAQQLQPRAYDCLIGEKIWEQIQRQWDQP